MSDDKKFAMAMNPESQRDVSASAIFEDIGLHSIKQTNKKRPVIIHQDGSVSVIFRYEGLNNTSMTENDLVKMYQRVKTTIDDLDPELVTVSHTQLREESHSAVKQQNLPTHLRPRNMMLDTLASDYKLFENYFYVSIHLRNDEIHSKKNMVISMYNQYILKKNDLEISKEKAMSKIDERVAKISELQDFYMDMVRDAGCRVVPLKTVKAYDDILQKFTRPRKSKTNILEIDHNDMNFSPRQQLFADVDAKKRKKDFVLDDYFHRVYTLSRAPRQVIYGNSIELIQSFPAEFIYTVMFNALTPKETSSIMGRAEKNALANTSSNNDKEIRDRSLDVEYNRIINAANVLANSDSVGVLVSANFILRIKEEFIEKKKRIEAKSREEIIREYDNKLFKGVFLKFGLSEWINEENTQWPVFCQCIPGMGSNRGEVSKQIFISSANLPYMLPFFDKRRPEIIHNGTNHFIDDSGNRIDVDLFDPSLEAWNWDISGQTGAGKSVLVNTFLTFLLAQRAVDNAKSPIICILDVGGDRGSYTKYFDLEHGTVINLSRRVKPAIQMFELIPDESVPMPRKVEKISKFMFAESRKHHCTYSESETEKRVYDYFNARLNVDLNKRDDPLIKKELFTEAFEFPYNKDYEDILKLKAGECLPDERTWSMIMSCMEYVLSTNMKQLDAFVMYKTQDIKELVRESYLSCEDRFPYMTDIFHTAKEMFDESTELSKQLLQSLKDYTREGSYPMFDRDTEIDMSKDMILADLKGLEYEPNLQGIYTILIQQVFYQKMYYIKNRRKIIIRDEAWSVMKNERARKFFVEDLRTARKNGFATMSISQLPTDYYNPSPEDGKAIVSNMQAKIFCKFNNPAICEEVGRHFGLPDEMIRAMETLGLQRDRDGVPTHSKFLLLLGKQIYILNNILHPFEYQLYSSSADDNAVIDYYLKETRQFDTLEETLWFIANKGHHGDKDLVKFLREAGAKPKFVQSIEKK